MPPSPSARVVRGVVATPFAFAPLPVAEPEPPEAASGFVAWESPGADEQQAAEDAAYERGVAAGRAEAEAAFQQEIEALRSEHAEAQAAHEAALAERARQTREAAERLSQAWVEAVTDLQPRLVDFALGVVEGMLGAPPNEAVRQAGLQALAEAVDALADGNPTTVSLHPVDLLQHQESGFAETLTGAHPLLRWEPDSALAPGDWVVSTPEAAVRRITSEALASLRDRLGLAP